MNTRIIFILLILACCHSAGAQKETKWKQLFNGRNLKGWKPKISGYELGDNFGNTFRVRDGKIVVSYDQYDSFSNRFGHLFYKKAYSHYLLAVEYRFTGSQVKGGASWAYKNSGVMLHCQSPGSMTKNQDFPISLEDQILGGDSTGIRPTCNLCTPGTEVIIHGKQPAEHCIKSSSPTYRNEEWVRAEVLVLGDSVIKHIVNGDTVLVYEKPSIGGGVVNNYDPAAKPDGRALVSGFIALQSESSPIEFRKVEIIDLSKKYRKQKISK
jgi:hypothetical protein